jgi:hypothetical protein
MAQEFRQAGWFKLEKIRTTSPLGYDIREIQSVGSGSPTRTYSSTPTEWSFLERAAVMTPRSTTPRKPPPVQLPRLAAVLVARTTRSCGPCSAGLASLVHRRSPHCVRLTVAGGRRTGGPFHSRPTEARPARRCRPPRARGSCLPARIEALPLVAPRDARHRPFRACGSRPSRRSGRSPFRASGLPPAGESGGSCAPVGARNAPRSTAFRSAPDSLRWSLAPGGSPGHSLRSCPAVRLAVLGSPARVAG